MITQSKDTQDQMTPDSALQALKDGNRRFVQKNMESRDLLEQVSKTASGQFPFATILGCIDSRVSNELIFDQGIGDIFSVRIAGNILNGDILGSMEFATQLAGTKLVVVLGHTACGAVKGACSGAELGNLTGLLDKIKPAIERETQTTENRNGDNPEFVQNVVDLNIDHTLERIRNESEVLRNLENEGSIKILGALYDVATGEVSFR